MKKFNLKKMAMTLVMFANFSFILLANAESNAIDATGEETAILDKVADESKIIVKEFPKNKTFGDVVIDNKHFPFINVALAAKQGLMKHSFHKIEETDSAYKHKIIVHIKISAVENKSTFREFINRFNSKSDINLIDDKGKVIGCVEIWHYQLAVNGDQNT